MKAEDLLQGINNIDDDLILDAMQAGPVHRLHRRKLSAILLAASLSLILLGCTYAVLSGSEWFKVFFRDQTEQALTAGQERYIEEQTEEIAQSVTLNGYTLTVESAIADQYTAYIKLKLTAPPGEVLDAESYLDGIPNYQDPSYRKTLTRSDGKDYAGGSSMSPQDDGNPADGSFSILHVFNLFPNTETTFDEEGIWTLHYQDFCAYYDSGETKTIMEGSIDFDIVFTKINNEEVTVVTQPLPYAFKSYRDHDAYLANEPDITEGFITSLNLRTMSATMTIEGHTEPVGFLKVPIVMKDGSRVYMQARSFGNGIFAYTLSAPIVMDEVDHILLEDGTQLAIPQ